MPQRQCDIEAKEIPVTVDASVIELYDLTKMPSIVRWVMDFLHAFFALSTFRAISDFFFVKDHINPPAVTTFLFSLQTSQMVFLLIPVILLAVR